MQKVIIVFLLVMMATLTGLFLLSTPTQPQAAIMEPNPEIVVLTTIPPLSTVTPTPELTPVSIIIETPVPTPELKDYDYPEYEANRISRAIFSVTPENPTYETKKAFAEIPQNMVDDYKQREKNKEKIQYYREDITSNLLMETEFPSYDGSCYKNLVYGDERKKINDEIADYVMRSWYYATITGNRSYRITPQSGVRYSFYNVNGWDYIKIYDLDWNIVYDSGKEL